MGFFLHCAFRVLIGWTVNHVDALDDTVPFSFAQVMSILAPQNYIDNKEEVLFARSPLPNFLNYRRRRHNDAKKPEEDVVVDILNDEGIDFDDTFDFAQFVRTHGHRIDHMIKKCHWKSQPCGPENFTAVITEFGLCYTFNSG